MTKREHYYKIARPDGWDFYTGCTINYRQAVGNIVRHPNPHPELGLCSPGVLHASLRAEDCFVGGSIPCSLYVVEGIPTVKDDRRTTGFSELRVIEELNPSTFFKWRYDEACNPVNPFLIIPPLITDDILRLLQSWASVRDLVTASVRDLGTASAWDLVWASANASVWASANASVWASANASFRDLGKASVWASVMASIEASVGASVTASFWDSVMASVWASINNSIGASAWASVNASFWASVTASVKASAWASVNASFWDSVWAYIGWIFAPIIPNWRNNYPYQSAVDLWKQGLLPSFDGQIWRLHGGKAALPLWSGKLPKEANREL